MGSQVSHRLPDRFPVGTRYVVEGRNGHIHLRYLEFPDGRHVVLPADPVERAATRPRNRAASRHPMRRQSRARK